jgi:hypothetical protein
MSGKYCLGISSSFCLALALAGRLFAQQDLQVMVNGPWAYAPDPSDNSRIVLVAPNSSHHKTYIFSGTDAGNLKGRKEINVGVYSLSMDKTDVLPSDVSRESPAVYTIQVPADRVTQVAKGTPPNNLPVPYVISLPKPTSFSTFLSPDGRFEGYSESKLYNSDSSHNHPDSVRPGIYTTWMVLHYGVASIPPTVQVKDPSGNSVPYPTDAKDGTLPGISIVTGDPKLENKDNECDYISLESFVGQRDLWGSPDLKYVRFPMEQLLPPGQQIHYQYSYGCRDDMVPPEVMRLAEGRLHILSGGSADCHLSQISVNSTVLAPSNK